MPNSSRLLRSVALLGSSLLAATNAVAATRIADSIASLESRLGAAAPGDRIVLKDGHYTATAPIVLRLAGTAAQPIVIAAETVGGATIEGAAGFKFERPAAFVTIEGFVFTHRAGGAVIGGGTSHCRISRCVFECAGEGAYLTVTGDDAEVDRNEFRNKKTLGNMIGVTGTGSQVARRLWIHHNYFHDFANAHGNGGETIRFGLSGLSMSTGAGLVEYNLFVRCTGENELISNKSCGNTYRYNTFLDSPGAELSQRHGNHCLIYGNYFRRTQGIRLFGDGHQIFSNYLEGNSVAISIGNGDGEVADGAKLTSHDRPDNCVIAFNTLVNNTEAYRMQGRASGLGATNTTFANNIIQGGGKVAAIDGPNAGAKWSGNILWKTGDAGDLPAAGYTTADPHLSPDQAGVYHILPGSPAIDSAVGDFPAVAFDMDGQPRPAAGKDVGADEFSTVPVVARILTVDDVGPGSIAPKS